MKLWEKNINDEKSARKAHVSSYFRALLDVANVLTCLCLVISKLSTSIKMALSSRPLVVISYHLALSLSPVIFYSSGSADISNGGCLFIFLFVLPSPPPTPACDSRDSGLWTSNITTRSITVCLRTWCTCPPAQYANHIILQRHHGNWYYGAVWKYTMP